MKNIIETILLEFDKSNFVLRLVENDSGIPYVEIIQTINTENKMISLKLNPSVLSDIIKVLQNFHAKIDTQYSISKNFITEEEQQRIIRIYLKGISIKDLALTFDQSEELIEMILRNKGIKIT